MIFPYSPIYKCLKRYFFDFFASQRHAAPPGKNFNFFFNLPMISQNYLDQIQPFPPQKWVVLFLKHENASYRCMWMRPLLHHRLTSLQMTPYYIIGRFHCRWLPTSSESTTAARDKTTGSSLLFKRGESVRLVSTRKSVVAYLINAAWQARDGRAVDSHNLSKPCPWRDPDDRLTEMHGRPWPPP